MSNIYGHPLIVTLFFLASAYFYYTQEEDKNIQWVEEGEIIIKKNKSILFYCLFLILLQLFHWITYYRLNDFLIESEFVYRLCLFIQFSAYMLAPVFLVVKWPTGKSRYLHIIILLFFILIGAAYFLLYSHREGDYLEFFNSSKYLLIPAGLTTLISFCFYYRKSLLS